MNSRTERENPFGTNKAALAVNRELILLYWDLGKMIAERENVWGGRLLEQISADLKLEFSDTGGFSVRNLKYCRIFYQFYKQNTIEQQLVAQLQYTNNQSNIIRSQLENEFHQQTVDELVQQRTHNT